ncbi:MAG: methylmalonyl-CoA mutase family protein, partial [Caulobacteraceae bacterium]
SEATELAFAAASLVAYAKALAEAGFSMHAAFEGIVLGLAIDADPFASIVKLRAARALWARIADACGVDAPARIEARSSQRMLTRAEPWTNLIRLTSAGFAGATGGADTIVLGAFTDALGLPAAPARRLARSTQLILMEEANLGAVADPAAGCGYVEALTGELADAAWARFGAIEAAGGVARALSSGLISTWVAEGLATLEARLASGEQRVLGVTDFVPGEGGGVELELAPEGSLAGPEFRLEGPDSACPPLAAIRLEDLAP